MFKYELGQDVFVIYENKIKEGKIIARKNVENMKGFPYAVTFNDNYFGITYCVLFEKNHTDIYKEEHIFDTAESCIEYISK